MASTIKCEDEVLVFDALYDDLDDDTKSIIQNLSSCKNINMLHVRSRWDFMTVVSFQ